MMNPGVKRRRFNAGALALGLTAAGCSSPATRYYRIVPIPGAVQSTAALNIAVRGISLPAYLDKDQIITGAGGAYQLTLDNNTLWAGPLGSMLQAVLVQNLAQRLPNASITASGGAVVVPAAALIEVDVLQFDPDATGAIILTAQAAIKPAGAEVPGPTRRLTAQATQATQPTSDPAATAAVMSTLWASLADQLARLAASEGH